MVRGVGLPRVFRTGYRLHCTIPNHSNMYIQNMMLWHFSTIKARGKPTALTGFSNGYRFGVGVEAFGGGKIYDRLA